MVPNTFIINFIRKSQKVWIFIFFITMLMLPNENKYIHHPNIFISKLKIEVFILIPAPCYLLLNSSNLLFLFSICSYFFSLCKFNFVKKHTKATKIISTPPLSFHLPTTLKPNNNNLVKNIKYLTSSLSCLITQFQFLV